jgi:hypothetical protein
VTFATILGTDERLVNRSRGANDGLAHPNRPRKETIMRTLTLFVATLAYGLCAGRVTGAEFDVPGAFPSLQAAVAAASVSADEENYINLSEPVVATTAEVVLDSDFGPTRHLTVRPDPDATYERATVLSLMGCEPAFRLFGAGYVTLQDLDIVRNTTNCSNLIVIAYNEGQNTNNVIERCRIGSTWTVPGAPGFSYLLIQSPYGVVVRNCTFFSYFPGTFDIAIRVGGFGDPAQSLYLYNNVVADHKFFGIRVVDGVPGTLLVLRNNVVVNHPDIDPEPWAFWTEVVAGVTVITSHETAFATAGFEQGGFGLSLCCEPPDGETFLQFEPDELGEAFEQTAWVLDPEFDDPEDNHGLFHLLDLGILHDPGAWGVTVEDGVPAAPDIAVMDDIDRDVRPSGDPAHTDRGSDQVDPVLVAVDHSSLAEARSWAFPAASPTRSAELTFSAPASGTLFVEWFDGAGRRVHASRSEVTRGASGHVVWPEAPTGVYFYRIGIDGQPSTEIRGRLFVMR